MFTSFLVEKRKTICKMENSFDCSEEFTSILQQLITLLGLQFFLTTSIRCVAACVIVKHKGHAIIQCGLGYKQEL